MCMCMYFFISPWYKKRNTLLMQTRSNIKKSSHNAK